MVAPLPQQCHTANLLVPMQTQPPILGGVGITSLPSVGYGMKA